MSDDVTQQPATEHHDLAEALVDLSRAAQQRRTARRDLTEAGITVARAIRKHVRTYDDCDLSENLYYEVAGLVEEDAPEGTRPTPVLCRIQSVQGSDGKAREHFAHALEPIPGAKTRRYVDPRGDQQLYHLATPEQYLDFAEEAGRVIANYAQDLRDDAQTWTEAAGAIAKLTPR